MTIEEQKRIAKDMGRLYAWRGQIQQPRVFVMDPVMMNEWKAGYAEQCNVMSATAEKVPLLFTDERAKR